MRHRGVVAVARERQPDLAALFMETPAELLPFQPSRRYLLIDQQRLDEAALEASSTLLALLLRMELSSAPEVRDKVLPALVSWFADAPQASQMRSVEAWLECLAKQRGAPPSFTFDSVKECADMGRQYASWAEEVDDIGFQRGKEIGQRRATRRAHTAVTQAFRPPAGAAAQRMRQTNQSQLEQWCERSLDAPGLDAVFGDDELSTQTSPG